jgi:hypothetical protein
MVATGIHFQTGVLDFKRSRSGFFEGMFFPFPHTFYVALDPDRLDRLSLTPVSGN